ncbi:response regulator [uncultured Mucilaginibacter sp.]|uniref:response regulator n=1 Tax=uncultured Mucilaginibacter sp. TaxID=797541 RepID=UPI0025EBAE3C|nr:response regulator [uncultured Mucilaginibacter sp.]
MKVKKKVLVVENDYDIRNIVAFILEEEGFECMGIPEPQSLDSLMAFKPHVILIDELINNQPGHRLCLKIKQFESLKHIPVIILSTANNIELIAEECKADEYIRKPFDVHEIVGKVISVIDKQPLDLLN